MPRWTQLCVWEGENSNMVIDVGENSCSGGNSIRLYLYNTYLGRRSYIIFLVWPDWVMDVNGHQSEDNCLMKCHSVVFGWTISVYHYLIVIWNDVQDAKHVRVKPGRDGFSYLINIYDVLWQEEWFIGLGGIEPSGTYWSHLNVLSKMVDFSWYLRCWLANRLIVGELWQEFIDKIWQTDKKMC